MQKKIQIIVLASVIAGALFFVSLLGAKTLINYITEPSLDSLELKITQWQKEFPSDRIYLTSNQPIYSPGESIWFSAFVKDEADFKSSSKSQILHVELITPSGKVQQKLNLIARKGYCSGDITTDPNIPGGFYKLRAYTDWMLNESDSAGYVKEILIQKVVLPRVKMNLTFEKDSYTKGEEVLAKFVTSTNDNKVLVNKNFSYEIQIDGLKVKTGEAITGNEGIMYVKYNLPEKLKSRDALLIIKMDYEGTTESISRSIPIASNNISISFFPEGGDMINGLASKVAFTSKNDLDKAVSVEGVIKDSKGLTVAKFSTYHKGMGAFSLTPKQGETYTAFITKPSDIEKSYLLPDAISAGFSSEINTDKNEIKATIRSTGTFKVYTVAQVRGKIYYSHTQLVNEGENNISIPTQNFPMGVAQVTFFDQQMIPRAERLVYVNRDRQMSISIKTEKQQYQTREVVTATVRTTDENGIPVPAFLSMKVLNDQLLNFADDKSSNIIPALTLEYDLKEKIEEPNFYFDKEEPKSMQALDLLMMTSGWRKFTWKQILKNQKPAYSHLGEMANIKMNILDGYTGKAIPNAKIKIEQTGSIFYSDANGKAFFNNIDLYEPLNFIVSADNYQSSTALISNYSDQTLWLYSNLDRELRVFEDAVPQVNVKGFPAMANCSPPQVMGFQHDIQDEPQMKKNIAPDFAKEEPMVIEKNKDEFKKEEIRNDNKEEVLDKRLMQILVADSITVNNQNQNFTYYRTRVFSQKKYSTKTPEKRTDFASTLYFNGSLETDYSGKASFTFTSNDLISSFRIVAEGISDDGLVGRGEKVIFTQLPFSISSKIPGTLTGGDKMLLPVILKNNTLRNITGKLNIFFSNKILYGKTGDTVVNVAAQSTKVIYWNMIANDTIANDTIQLAFNSEGLNDYTTVPVSIDSKGFPVQVTLTGKDLDRNFDFAVKDALKGSLKVSMTAYPSTVSTLLKGLAGMLRMPGGCFEQTSMSSYPNAMIMDYMKQTESGDPATYATAKEYLKAGYNKLVAFETSQKGYEWFGSAPGHEALTAYGLMQFNEYKKLYPAVDEEMVQRNVKWLLNRRDGNGGYLRSDKAADYFGRASEEVTNCYITYALSEAGYKDINKETDYSYNKSLAVDDAYLMSLAANTLYNIKDDSRAEVVMKKLVGKQNADGSFNGRSQSITCSSGSALTVETSSLALMAMLSSNIQNFDAISRTANYIIKQQSGYGDFGNTQATILALKALTKFSIANKRTPEAGTIEFLLDDTKIAEMNFEAGENKPIEITGLEKYILEGDHKIRIRYKGVKVALPYTISITYNIATPKSDKECKLSMKQTLSTNSCKVGDVVRMNVILKNQINEGLASPIAIVGIPAGLSLQAWQLKEMKEKMMFDYFEIINNNLVIYYRAFKGDEVKELIFDLKAELPGTYQAQASNTYQYYTNEYKDWEQADVITINQ